MIVQTLKKTATTLPTCSIYILLDPSKFAPKHERKTHSDFLLLAKHAPLFIFFDQSTECFTSFLQMPCYLFAASFPETSLFCLILPLLK